MISLMFWVVEYDIFSVCLLNAEDNSLFAGKCLLISERNCLPILVERFILYGGFQYVMLLFLFFFLGFSCCVLIFVKTVVVSGCLFFGFISFLLLRLSLCVLSAFGRISVFDLLFNRWDLLRPAL